MPPRRQLYRFAPIPPLSTPLGNLAETHLVRRRHNPRGALVSLPRHPGHPIAPQQKKGPAISRQAPYSWVYLFPLWKIEAVIYSVNSHPSIAATTRSFAS